MQNLIVRAISGSVYVALIILGIFYVPSGTLFLAALLGSFALVEWQFFNPSKDGSVQVAFSVSQLLLALYIFAHDFISPQNSAILLALSLILVVWQFSRSLYSDNEEEDALRNLFHSAFGLVYIIPALVVMAWLGAEAWLLMSIFILIWSNDSFAYLVGRFLGRNKLAPKLSPKKTWEGFMGGLVFTVVAALILDHLLQLSSLNQLQWIGLAVLVVISATLGDLFESALKRKHHLKDSGNFMPGHGGILDRIDSLLLVMPVAYLYLKLIASL